MDSGDGAAHFYNPDLTTEHWNWHVRTRGHQLQLALLRLGCALQVTTGEILNR